MNRGAKGALLFLALVLVLAATPSGVSACGGRTATIADNPKALGGRPVPWQGGLTYYEDGRSGVVLPASAVKISSALAEAIARRYLERTYGRYEHLEFEAFTLEILIRIGERSRVSIYHPPLLPVPGGGSRHGRGTGGHEIQR
jgi:hypothetical protein